MTIVPQPATYASYAPHTVYNAAPAPTSGTCASEKTVYSTVVVEVTKTVEKPSGPTHGAGETYTFTLPNGSPITTVISPTHESTSTSTYIPGAPGTKEHEGTSGYEDHSGYEDQSGSEGTSGHEGSSGHGGTPSTPNTPGHPGSGGYYPIGTGTATAGNPHATNGTIPHPSGGPKPSASGAYAYYK